MSSKCWKIINAYLIIAQLLYTVKGLFQVQIYDLTATDLWLVVLHQALCIFCSNDFVSLCLIYYKCNYSSMCLFLALCLHLCVSFVFPSTVDVASTTDINDACSSYLMTFCYSSIFFVLEGNICMSR